jgi:hypothetical protein
MKKGFTAAKHAVAEHLAAASLPVMLYTLSVIADQAAFRAGRMTELYSSLFSYEELLPAGYCGFWKKTGEGGGLFVVDRAEKRENYRPLPGVFDAGVDMGWIEERVS